MIPNLLTARQNSPGAAVCQVLSNSGTTSVDGVGYLDGSSAGASTTLRPIDGLDCG